MDHQEASSRNIRIVALCLSVCGGIFAVAVSFTNCSIQTPGVDSSASVDSQLTDTFDPKQSLSITAAVPAYANAAITSITTSNETIQMVMNHGAVDTTSCTTCHTGTTYYPGIYHASIISAGVAAPTTCIGCHSIANHPTGFVGANASSTTPSDTSGEMKHDAVTWSPSASFVYSQSGTAIVTQDCSVCHTVPSSSNRPSGTAGDATLWTTNPSGTPKYHASLAAATGQSQPTSCLDCHSATRPTSTAQFQDALYNASPFDYVVNNNGVPHGGGADCAVCHQSQATPPGSGTQSFQGGHMPHGAGTPASVTCVSCHITQRPDIAGTPSAASIGFDHSTLALTTDCFACHQATVTNKSYVNFPTDWAGGL